MFVLPRDLSCPLFHYLSVYLSISGLRLSIGRHLHINLSFPMLHYLPITPCLLEFLSIYLFISIIFYFFFLVWFGSFLHRVSCYLSVCVFVWSFSFCLASLYMFLLLLLLLRFLYLFCSSIPSLFFLTLTCFIFLLLLLPPSLP